MVGRFSQPHVRAHLEKLVGTNVVSLTDRAFMMKLQEKVIEEYKIEMDKRIEKRKEAELERVKELVLTGVIPISEAPPQMSNHPVVLIEQYCNKLIEERRAKMKKPAAHIPQNLYFDNTPDPPSGLSIEEGHIFRPNTDQLCLCPFTFLDSTDEEDIEQGYMFTEEDYSRLKYESEAVKLLRESETVQEMYELADQIMEGIRVGVA